MRLYPAYRSYDDYLRQRIGDRPSGYEAWCPNRACNGGTLVVDGEDTDEECPVCEGDGKVELDSSGDMILPRGVEFEEKS